MSEYNVLLIGESWVALSFEIKGRNVLQDSTYEEAAAYLVAALESAGANVEFVPCHAVHEEVPSTVDGLDVYDLVLLSDVGADTLQITPRVAAGETAVDRCKLLAEYVAGGGALGMIGGYMSFAGKCGAARYGRTAVGDVLPVTVARSDDRIEAPDGPHPRPTSSMPGSPPSEWPSILGYNRFEAADDAEVWATVRDDPFLVVGDHGDGSAFAFATDCAPHWAPQTFLEWEYLPTLWASILDRVTE
ncbi:glutamine amidotransferase [Halopelagius fulvigenes]|uniref:Glutamine amidotransferase n=1 Tax=Halopelagius fulvigenes TaxID=1198324 RepID=A0ABD5TVZ1_9EURY